MFWKNRNKSTDEALDRVVKTVSRASGIGEEKADEAASSPFLYARLRARIEAERAEQNNGWFETFKVARRAILSLALVAIAAVGSLWITGSRTTVSAPPDSAIVEPVSQLSPVSACSLTATDGCAISNEEVLATMFADQKGKE